MHACVGKDEGYPESGAAFKSSVRAPRLNGRRSPSGRGRRRSFLYAVAQVPSLIRVRTGKALTARVKGGLAAGGREPPCRRPACLAPARKHGDKGGRVVPRREGGVTHIQSNGRRGPVTKSIGDMARWLLNS